jgi:glycosyltransferase involved in cell wall biosynthesis
MTNISAVIITRNEEENIRHCLESVVQVADEIIVIDSHSTDNTVNICREYPVNIFQLDWQGYAYAKNFGIGKTSNDYILSIDADELLSEPLIHSIQTVKRQLEGAYSFNRLSNYCGQWIHHCGWYPDRKIRLFSRSNARWYGDFVHEKLQFNDPVEVINLKGDLLHYSFRSLSDHIQRVDQYSQLAAEELVQVQKRLIILKMIVLPFIKFLKSYVFQNGFADGFYGFCISAISGFDVFLRYAKVIQINRHRIKQSE